MAVFLLDLLVIRPWESRHGSKRSDGEDASLEFAVPRTVFFHPGHVWVRIDDDGCVTVGIDDLVRTAIGDLSMVELPSVGDRVIAGHPAMAVRQGERWLRMVAPLSGRVVETNRDFGHDPVRLRWRPYKEGWTYRLDPEVGATRDIASLRIGKEAAVWMEGEIERLRHRFDVGTLGPPVEGSVTRADDRAWSAFERGFLRVADSPGGPPA